MSTPVALTITLLLLAGNAFFVGAEFAVTSSRRSQLEPLVEAGDARAATALWALQHISRMLATAQLGVTLCSTGLGVVAEPAIARIVQPLLTRVGVGTAGAHAAAVVVALVLVVYLHVVAGEMVPKNISISSPESAVRWLAPPLVQVSRLFGPVVTGLNGFANWVLHRLGVETRDEVSAAFNAAEVASIVERSTAEGVLDDDTGLLSGALEFSEETAGSVMVPLDGLVTLPKGCTPQDVEHAVASTGYSRFPLVSARSDGDAGGDVIVGFPSCRARACVRASSRTTVVVLPVPGPPVIMEKGEVRARAQAIFCQFVSTCLSGKICSNRGASCAGAISRRMAVLAATDAAISVSYCQ